MPDEMTPERALIILNQCNTDGRIKVDRQELKEAVKVACEAINKYKVERLPRSRHNVDNGIFYLCPICKTMLVRGEEKYCHVCGQTIDWSDIDWSNYE